MVKELFLAILLGALLGFRLTGSVIGIRHRNAQQTVNTNLTPTAIPSQSTATTPPTNPTTTPLPANHPLLTVISPEDESVVSVAKTEVKGSATPNSLIVLKTIKNIYSTTADTQGNFTQVIELENGYNTILITSIDHQDNSSSVDLNITLSTAKF